MRVLPLDLELFRRYMCNTRIEGLSLLRAARLHWSSRLVQMFGCSTSIEDHSCPDLAPQHLPTSVASRSSLSGQTSHTLSGSGTAHVTCVGKEVTLRSGHAEPLAAGVCISASRIVVLLFCRLANARGCRCRGVAQRRSRSSRDPKSQSAKAGNSCKGLVWTASPHQGQPEALHCVLPAASHSETHIDQIRC